ncbi:MAG: hypothetical protein SH808_10260 [Saprospiraceae bacterium]|nr:hypothetical protein [Saprospiraceae bacterium]
MRRFIAIGTFLIVLVTFSSYTYFRTFNATEAEAHGFDFEFKGVNLVAPISEWSDHLPDEFIRSNINAVALNPYAFVSMEEGTVSYNTSRQWWGEKTEGIRECAGKLHTAGFRLMLKPHMWVNHQMYTGDLKFSSEEAWTTFENEYRVYIIDFARLAEDQGIEVFCIGTELREAVATRPEYWTRLIREIRSVYHGKLTYAANWDEYDKVPFWTSLDFIGIDAYFPLSGSDTPSVEELKRSWRSWMLRIDNFQKGYKKYILFTEFGYRNTNRCAQEPWKEDNEIVNYQAQMNAYEALFQSFSWKPWFAGGFAWKWYSDDYFKKGIDIDFTPQGKPATGVLEKWYR